MVCACALLATGLWAQPTPSSAPTGRRGVIVTIADEINDITFTSLKRRVEQAREAGADLVILEMDTPGGLVTSALDICTYLKNLTDLKSVAWVRPSAFSAGAMISLACDEVVMASASKIGDCAPIMFSPTEGLQELGKTERAKAESPILKEFRDSAHRRHYDPLLCEAMVRQGSEIWWIENGQTHERRFALKRDKEKLLGEEKSAWRLVEKMKDPVSGEELSVRQPVVEDRDLLTLTQSEAVAYGFARAIVSSEKELRDYYSLSGPLLRLEANWAEIVADFLSSPLVRGILMMLMALGVYAEFNAPGHFVGAGVALVALIVFLGAPYLTGLADAWEILLVLVGAVLLAIEIFAIPGFGIAGIAGILLMITGFVATFVPAEPGPIALPTMPGTWRGLEMGLRVVFGGVGAGVVGMVLLNKWLPKMPGARELLLEPGAAVGGRSASLSAGAFLTGLSVGDVGTTLTLLRPAGKAMIGGRRVDVITQGQAIEPQREVQVVEVSGARIVVRETTGG